MGHHHDDDANDQLQKQMDENDAQLESKREALAHQEMAIVHAQGAQNWTPEGVPMQPFQPSQPVQKDSG